MRKTPPARPEGRSANPHLVSSRWSISRRALQVPIICIAVGIGVLYCSERSIGALFSTGADTTSAFAAAEAFASSTLQTMWRSAVASVSGEANSKSTSDSPASPAQAPAPASITSQSANLMSSSLSTSIPQPANLSAPSSQNTITPTTMAGTSTIGAGVVTPPNRIGPITNATIAGTGWKGTVNNGNANTGNWSNPGNWDSNGPATDERNLFFGSAYATAGGTNFVANNDIVGYTGYRITFESVASPVSFTLSGNALTLADFGGNDAKIENQSTVNQNLNFAGLQFAGGLTFAEINAVNGGLTFGSTDTIGFAGSVAGIKLFGGGQTVTFNNTINGTGKYFAFTTANPTGNTVNINGSATTGDWYVMNGGTLNLNSTGSLTTSAIRLGGDFATTGNQDQTKNGTFQLTSTTGGQTFSSIINPVAGATGTLSVNSLNTSNTNTLSGSIFLDSNLNMSEASGGILALTGGTLDLKAQTLFLLGNGGTISIGDVISSSTNSANGQLVIGTNGTPNTAPTVTLSNTNTYIGQTFVRGGALQFATGGTINNSTIRLGSTSGAAINAAINLINATGGQTIGSVINPVALTSGSGTLTLNSQNTSGTNTLNNHIGLDRNFAITQSAGGALNITQAHTDGATAGTGYDIKGFTATFTPASTGAIVDSGDIYSSTGTGSVAMNGAGALTLSGANSFAGGLALSGANGTTTGTNSSALGSGLITVSASAVTLNLRNDANTVFNNNGLTLNSSSATTVVSADQATGAGTNHTLTLTGTVSIADGRTLSISTGNGYTLALGAVVVTGSSAPSVSFAGAGTGTLASVTGTASATTSTVSFKGTGTTTVTGNILNGGGALTLQRNTAAGTLVLQGTGSNYTGATTITTGTIRTAVATNGFGNTSGIGIGGSGILDLRNDNSVAFSNGTTNYAVSTSGTGATINVDQATGAGTNKILTIGTLTIGGNHQLNITGGNGYSLATGAVTETGATNNAFNPTTASVALASITGTNTPTNLTGTTSGNTVGAISTGTGTLSKNGASIWTLTASDSFTGATAVNAGTLIAGATGSLGSTTSIVVNSSGTLALSGSGNLNRINNAAPITLGTTSLGAGTILRSGNGTVSEGAGAHNTGASVTGTSSVGLGALTLASNSTLDFGTGGVGTFTFASYSPAGFTLNILNYTSSAVPASNVSGTDGTDDRLIFNQDQSANLAFFSFNGQGAGEIALDSGFFEVVPVPEPGTWFAGALAIGVVGWTQRRRLCALRRSA